MVYSEHLTAPAWLTLLAVTAAAQDPAVDRSFRGVAVLDDLADAGIELVRVGREIREVRFGAGEVEALLKTPVSDVEVAALGADRYVVYAGGVREDLDVYIVDLAAGLCTQPLETGGRRLPDDFSTGFPSGGSWPVLDGELLLFAYHKDGAHVFRAVDYGGNVLIAREYREAGINGFTVSQNPDSHALTVDFGGVVTLRCRHPLAPALEFDEPLVETAVDEDCGTSRVAVPIRNSGGRELKAEVFVEGEAFYLVGSNRLTLAPGASTALAVDFAPERPGEFRARVIVRTEIYEMPDGVVALEGVAAPEVLAFERSAIASGPVTRPAEAQVAVVTEPPAARPRLPAFEEAVRDYRVLRPEQGKVVCAGHVTLDPALYSAGEPPTLRFENRSTDARIEVAISAVDGWFWAGLDGRSGDALRVALVDDRTAEPTYLELAPVLPMLAVHGDDIVVRARANASYQLHSVRVGPAGRVTRILRTWRGSVDGEGVARIPADQVGGRGRGLRFVVWVEADRPGGVLASGVVRLD